jgi:CHASE2 domain-containing sensor protein
MRAYFRRLVAGIDRRRFLMNYLWLGVLALFWIVLNPFRLIGFDQPPSIRLLSILGAQLDYPRDGQSAITVVTVSERELNRRGDSWPLPVAQWQLLLERIACYAPRALFVDAILYKTEAEDPGWAGFAEMIAAAERGELTCGGRARPKFPIVLARGGAADEIGSSRIGEDALAVTTWPAESGYPLSTSAGEERRPTAAYALIRRLCAEPDGRGACPPAIPAIDGDSIDVVWGADLPPRTAVLVKAAGVDCMTPATLREKAIGDIPLSLLQRQNPRYQPCSYHHHLSLEQFAENTRACALQNENACTLMQELFKDRVIMIGVIRPGLADMVYSPIHGSLPGVFYHAMAFDNLLLMGSDYFKTNLVDRVKIWLVTMLLLMIPALIGISTNENRHRWWVVIIILLMSFVSMGFVFYLSVKAHWLSPANAAMLLALFMMFVEAARVELKLRDYILDG